MCPFRVAKVEAPYGDTATGTLIARFLARVKEAAAKRAEGRTAKPASFSRVPSPLNIPRHTYITPVASPSRNAGLPIKGYAAQVNR